MSFSSKYVLIIKAVIYIKFAIIQVLFCSSNGLQYNLNNSRLESLQDAQSSSNAKVRQHKKGMVLVVHLNMLVLIFALTVYPFPIDMPMGKINQILIIIIKQSFHFNFHFTGMIISRLFFGLARPTLTQQLSAAFAYANPTRTYSNIRSKIQSSRSFGEFSELLESKKSQISILDICSSSKHISGLINSKEKIDYKQIDNFITYFEKSDLSALNIRNLLNILVVFRNMKQRKIFSDTLQTLRNKIAAQVGTMIKQKNYREDEATELSSAYFEFSKQKIYGEAKMVADKLLALMEDAIKSDRALFNNSELSFLVISLSLRPNPTNKQTRIRQIILERLSKQCQVLPIEELVKIVSCFAKMQTYDFKNDQFSNIRQLVQKVTQRTDELDENQIIQLVRAKSSVKLPGYYEFLQKIKGSIFEAINSEGKSEIESDAFFKVLPLVTSKTSLKEEDIVKTMAFLEYFAKQCKTDPKRFSAKTIDFVTNPCLDYKGRQAFSKILQKYEFQLTINMMYQMALNRFNIDFIIKQLSQMSFENLSKQTIYKLSFVSYKISKGKSEILPVWQKFHALIAQDFTTPQKFIDTFRFLSRGDVKIEDISEIIVPQFNTLPNPFEGEAPAGAYTFYYIQAVLKCWKNKDVFQFLTKYQTKIKLADLLKISGQMLEDDLQSTSYSRPVITALSKRSGEIIDSKIIKDISSLINLVGKFNRMIIYSQIDNYSENNIFRILRNLQFKIKTLQQINIDGLYYSVLQKYISRNGNNYNYQHTFKSFIKFLLNHISEIKRPRVQSFIIEEGLSLDYVTKKHLESIDIEKTYLPYFSRTRALYIKDPAYTPDLTRFTNNSLEIIFTNPNLEKYIEANYKDIIEKIKSLDGNSAVYFASIFSIHKSAFCRKLMSELLNVISEKLKSSNRCNILGLFENALNNNYFSFYQFRKIGQKVVEDFKKFVNVFSIESHAELIKFLISQPGLNDQDYYTKVVQHFERKDDVSDSSLDQLYNRLSNTNFKFNEKQVLSVERMIKYNVSSGLHFFCMIQQLIPQANRSNYVKQIVQKITLTLEKQQDIRFNSAYIQYIKKVYPTQAGALNIPENRIYLERVSFKPNEEFSAILNKISENSVEQIKILGQDNYTVKVKENILVFIGNKKLGSYYDHEFLKRTITLIHQKPINVVCLTVGQQTASVIDFLNKSCPNTFNESLITAAIQQIKDKKPSNNKKKVQIQEQ